MHQMSLMTVSFCRAQIYYGGFAISFIHVKLYVCSVADAHLRHIAEYGVLSTGDISYPKGITSLHYCVIMELI